jgi:preprotein translocase subunit YajC
VQSLKNRSPRNKGDKMVKIKEKYRKIMQSVPDGGIHMDNLRMLIMENVGCYREVTVRQHIELMIELKFIKPSMERNMYFEPIKEKSPEEKELEEYVNKMKEAKPVISDSGYVSQILRHKVKIVMDIINRLSLKKKDITKLEMEEALASEGVMFDHEIEDIMDMLNKQGSIFRPSPDIIEKV